MQKGFGGSFEIVVGYVVELRDVVCGIIVFCFEDCCPLGKIENHDQAVTEEQSDLLAANHHSEIYYLTILELARNLQFCLQWGVHHVHVWRVRTREF